MDRALPDGKQGPAPQGAALSLALTGSTEGVTAEEPVDPVLEDDADSDADEIVPNAPDGDEDEGIVTANVIAGKEFPLAHRLLDTQGFRSISFLESVLQLPHEVCLILQKTEGVGLSLAWQLMVAMHESTKNQRLQVVSGSSKEGTWTDMHEANLPEMFRNFRRILAEQLEQRFNVTTTPDKFTLLSLAFDPSVDTSASDGIFAERFAAQRKII